jgi:hypothetical protein
MKFCFFEDSYSYVTILLLHFNCVCCCGHIFNLLVIYFSYFCCSSIIPTATVQPLDRNANLPNALHAAKGSTSTLPVTSTTTTAFFPPPIDLGFLLVDPVTDSMDEITHCIYNTQNKINSIITLSLPSNIE